MTPFRTLALALLVLTAAGCSSGSARPAAARTTHLVFPDSQFSATACPKDHPLANCFTGTGSATLAPLGRITISRTVVSGDQKRSAPSGCDPADTTGVLKDAHGGTAQISGTGKLCGLLATYTLVVDHGAASLAGVHLTGTITNNGGAESWDVVNPVAR